MLMRFFSLNRNMIACVQFQSKLFKHFEYILGAILKSAFGCIFRVKWTSNLTPFGKPHMVLYLWYGIVTNHF